MGTRKREAKASDKEGQKEKRIVQSNLTTQGG